jgi:hypothetical protein
VRRLIADAADRTVVDDSARRFASSSGEIIVCAVRDGNAFLSSFSVERSSLLAFSCSVSPDFRIPAHAPFGLLRYACE